MEFAHIQRLRHALASGAPFKHWDVSILFGEEKWAQGSLTTAEGKQMKLQFLLENVWVQRRNGSQVALTLNQVHTLLKDCPTMAGAQVGWTNNTLSAFTVEFVMPGPEDQDVILYVNVENAKWFVIDEDEL